MKDKEERSIGSSLFSAGTIGLTILMYRTHWKKKLFQAYHELNDEALNNPNASAKTIFDNWLNKKGKNSVNNKTVLNTGKSLDTRLDVLLPSMDSKVNKSEEVAKLYNQIMSNFQSMISMRKEVMNTVENKIKKIMTRGFNTEVGVQPDMQGVRFSSIEHPEALANIMEKVKDISFNDMSVEKLNLFLSKIFDSAIVHDTEYLDILKITPAELNGKMVSPEKFEGVPYHIIENLNNQLRYLKKDLDNSVSKIRAYGGDQGVIVKANDFKILSENINRVDNLINNIFSKYSADVNITQKGDEIYKPLSTSHMYLTKNLKRDIVKETLDGKFEMFDIISPGQQLQIFKDIFHEDDIKQLADVVTNTRNKAKSVIDSMVLGIRPVLGEQSAVPLLKLYQKYKSDHRVKDVALHIEDYGNFSKVVYTISTHPPEYTKGIHNAGEKFNIEVVINKGAEFGTRDIGTFRHTTEFDVSSSALKISGDSIAVQIRAHMNKINDVLSMFTKGATSVEISNYISKYTNDLYTYNLERDLGINIASKVSGFSEQGKSILMNRMKNIKTGLSTLELMTQAILPSRNEQKSALDGGLAFFDTEYNMSQELTEIYVSILRAEEKNGKISYQKEVILDLKRKGKTDLTWKVMKANTNELFPGNSAAADKVNRLMREEKGFNAQEVLDTLFSIKYKLVGKNVKNEFDTFSDLIKELSNSAAKEKATNNLRILFGVGLKKGAVNIFDIEDILKFSKEGSYKGEDIYARGIILGENKASSSLDDNFFIKNLKQVGFLGHENGDTWLKGLRRGGAPHWAEGDVMLMEAYFMTFMSKFGTKAGKKHLASLFRQARELFPSKITDDYGNIVELFPHMVSPGGLLKNSTYALDPFLVHPFFAMTPGFAPLQRLATTSWWIKEQSPFRKLGVQPIGIDSAIHRNYWENRSKEVAVANVYYAEGISSPIVSKRYRDSLTLTKSKEVVRVDSKRGDIVKGMKLDPDGVFGSLFGEVQSNTKGLPAIIDEVRKVGEEEWDIVYHYESKLEYGMGLQTYISKGLFTQLMDFQDPNIDVILPAPDFGKKGLSGAEVSFQLNSLAEWAYEPKELSIRRSRVEHLTIALKKAFKDLIVIKDDGEKLHVNLNPNTEFNLRDINIRLSFDGLSKVYRELGMTFDQEKSMVSWLNNFDHSLSPKSKIDNIKDHFFSQFFDVERTFFGKSPHDPDIANLPSFVSFSYKEYIKFLSDSLKRGDTDEEGERYVTDIVRQIVDGSNSPTTSSKETVDEIINAIKNRDDKKVLDTLGMSNLDMMKRQMLFLMKAPRLLKNTTVNGVPMRMIGGPDPNLGIREVTGLGFGRQNVGMSLLEAMRQMPGMEELHKEMTSDWLKSVGLQGGRYGLIRGIARKGVPKKFEDRFLEIELDFGKDKEITIISSKKDKEINKLIDQFLNPSKNTELSRKSYFDRAYYETESGQIINDLEIQEAYDRGDIKSLEDLVPIKERELRSRLMDPSEVQLFLKLRDQRKGFNIKFNKKYQVGLGKTFGEDVIDVENAPFFATEQDLYPISVKGTEPGEKNRMMYIVSNEFMAFSQMIKGYVARKGNLLHEDWRKYALKTAEWTVKHQGKGGVPGGWQAYAMEAFPFIKDFTLPKNIAEADRLVNMGEILISGNMMKNSLQTLQLKDAVDLAKYMVNYGKKGEVTEGMGTSSGLGHFRMDILKQDKYLLDSDGESILGETDPFDFLSKMSRLSKDDIKNMSKVESDELLKNYGKLAKNQYVPSGWIFGTKGPFMSFHKLPTGPAFFSRKLGEQLAGMGKSDMTGIGILLADFTNIDFDEDRLIAWMNKGGTKSGFEEYLKLAKQEGKEGSFIGGKSSPYYGKEPVTNRLPGETIESAKKRIEEGNVWWYFNHKDNQIKFTSEDEFVQIRLSAGFKNDKNKQLLSEVYQRLAGKEAPPKMVPLFWKTASYLEDVGVNEKTRMEVLSYFAAEVIEPYALKSKAGEWSTENVATFVNSITSMNRKESKLEMSKFMEITTGPSKGLSRKFELLNGKNLNIHEMLLEMADLKVNPRLKKYTEDSSMYMFQKNFESYLEDPHIANFLDANLTQVQRKEGGFFKSIKNSAIKALGEEHWGNIKMMSGVGGLLFGGLALAQFFSPGRTPGMSPSNIGSWTPEGEGLFNFSTSESEKYKELIFNQGNPYDSPKARVRMDEPGSLKPLMRKLEKITGIHPPSLTSFSASHDGQFVSDFRKNRYYDKDDVLEKFRRFS